MSTPALKLSLWRTFKNFLKDLLRGHLTTSTKSNSKTGASHFDGLDVPLIVVDRKRPIVDADAPDGDVVIATWWETAEWVANLSPRKGAKVYFLQHHEVFDYLPKERVEATWRLPLHKITISRWLVDLARVKYQDPDVQLLPNSVDTNQFFAPERNKQSYPTVGLLYSTIKWKGVDISLAAIELARKRIPDLRVIAFGVEAEADFLRLPPNSEYHQQPRQELAIRGLYASCDVWLCGSYSEGFHLPPLEAMACRCPVVSTRVGGPLDIIECGKNGYLVPIGNADELADRLVRVLSLDNARWRAMSEAALATATRYTWDDATSKLEEMLQKIVASDGIEKRV